MPIKHELYECRICETLYERLDIAAFCEERHLLDGKDDNFSRIDSNRIYNMIEGRNADPCDYCKHSHYVYGCEQNCPFRNKGECLDYGASKGEKFDPRPIDVIKKFVKIGKESESNNADIRW